MITQLKISLILVIITYVCFINFVCGQNIAKGSKVHVQRVLNSPKISESLKDKIEFLTQTGQPALVNIFIEFVGGNFKAINSFEKSEIAHRATATRAERISGLVEKLEAYAANSQRDVVDFLKRAGADYTQLWSTNEVFVKNVDPWILSELLDIFGTVTAIRPEGVFKPPKPITPAQVAAVSGITLSQDKFNIPQPIQQVNGRCRDIRCLGDGVVVAIIDTGVLWTHVELEDNYRKEFGWYDPINGTELPWFEDPKGTQAAGVILGKTTGIAPNAQWIACLAGGVDAYFEGPAKICGQWALCPSTWNDTSDRDCSKAPHIINNGWSITTNVQLYIPRNFFYGMQAAWNAAGIHSTFMAGNQGPYCTSVDPPAAYDNAFSVGAVDNTSTTLWSSAKGPVLNMEFDMGVDLSFGYERTCPSKCSDGYGWSNHTQSDACLIAKPDISAPGVNINSSFTDSDYSYSIITGTEPAAAMVSGVMSLMVCANNRLQGSPGLDVYTARHVLTSTASTKRINLEEGHPTGAPNNFAKISNLLCNVAYGNTCGTYPNNVYGWGEVDACAAVRKVKGRM